MGDSNGALAGKVALVAGGTRGGGRGIAVELGAAGATVYVTGRSSSQGRAGMDRPETIEETAAQVTKAGGTGISVRTDHSDPGQVQALTDRIAAEQDGRLDILVNSVWGGDPLADWEHPLWEHDLAGGLRMLRMGVDTHLVTSHHAIPLMLDTAREHGTEGLVVEMTDGTAEYNASFRTGVGFYYDLVKANVGRIVLGLTHELRDLPVTAMGVTPGWLRSENMLELFGVTEATWRDALEERPGFAISESPTYVARGVAAAASTGDASRWAGQIVTARQLADAYGVTDTDGSKPDCWGYVRDHGLSEQSGEDVDAYR